MKNPSRTPSPLVVGLAENTDHHTYIKKIIIKNTPEIPRLKQMIFLKIKSIMTLQRKFVNR
jgi:hypothetical protein